MKEEIAKVIEVLKRGGIILYPTDTVWGIGCDATNPEAVERVYKLKQSDNKHSMLVLVDSADRAIKYVNRAPEVAWQLIEVSDKPLTLILPNACCVAENLIPEDGTLGIRIPDHEFCHQLLRRFGRPIVSTSANISGESTPIEYKEISKAIKTGVDLVVNQRFESGMTHKPSSIIQLSENGEIKIIRE